MLLLLCPQSEALRKTEAGRLLVWHKPRTLQRAAIRCKLEMCLDASSTNCTKHEQPNIMSHFLMVS